MGFLAVFVLVAVVYVMGQVTTLTCKRVDQQVDCVAESKLLGLVPLQERTAPDVIGARLGTFCDDDGCRYRVELQSEAGVVPVTPYYTAGTAVKRSMIDQVNAFANDATATPLRVQEHLDPTTLILPALLIAGVYGWTLWRRRRTSKEK